MACASFTDEVQNSLSSCRGGRPWSHDSGNEINTGYRGTNLEEQESELSDTNSNETKLNKEWINYLKGKEISSGGSLPDNKLQTEISPVFNKELRAQQSFCTIKIDMIGHRVDSKDKSCRHKKWQLRLDAEVSDVEALNCTVPDELLSKLYFKNLSATLKQVEEAKQHTLSECPSCNRKRAELAQSAFLKRKKTLLESLVLQEKIDEHLHTTDFLTRVGEAHQGLPRLSDDPRMIWKRLMKLRSSTVELKDSAPRR